MLHYYDIECDAGMMQGYDLTVMERGYDLRRVNIMLSQILIQMHFIENALRWALVTAVKLQIKAALISFC